MADSATPRIADLPGCVAVAYSGGRDSTALLHAVARQAREAGIEVLAFHIHHGLSAHADEWLAHCQQQCVDWRTQGLPVRFEWRRLSGGPASAQSVEAWAREQRYAALVEMARAAGVDLLLLAHHRRDQAETLLLQGLRGAGVAGLAGMPTLQWREGICWARPWLAQPREAIEAYVSQHGLRYVEDDSNADPRFARNRLRLSVWPMLSDAFPQAEASLSQAATWAQQALELQNEIADHDLRALDDEQSGLDLAGLLALSPVRQRNALRTWLARQTGRPASASLVDRLQAELPSAGQGAWPSAGAWLRLYRGRLSWSAAETRPLPPSQIVNLGSVGRHEQADWGGAWQVEMTSKNGVSLALLQDLTLRPRQGGEQFQRAPRSSARSLKKAHQEAGVPAWLRDGPLLFCGDRLLFVAGLGIDARMFAAPGEPQCSVQWLPQQ